MKNLKIIMLFFVSVLVFCSCSNQPSLQKYFIEHQNDKDFIAIDIPASLLDKDEIELSAEEKEALESIKKVNFLALPMKEGTKARFDQESIAISEILDSDSYETLMRFGSNGTKAVLKYQGEEDDIDEVIVFASNTEKGLAIARVLGDNMRPEKMAKLINSIEKEKLNLGAFDAISKALQENM